MYTNYCFTGYGTFSQMTENMVIELMNFLQSLYLLHILCALFTFLRYVFFGGENGAKIALSYKTEEAGGVNHEFLVLDEHLLNATDLAATFIMFYMVPPWVSILFYFIICRICLRGVLHFILLIARQDKLKMTRLP